MEHIIQFGVTIDDDAIKKRIEEQALNQVVEDIKADALEAVGAVNKYQWDTRVREIVNHAVSGFLEDHKDEILTMAANKLTERLANMKIVKEKVNQIVEEMM